MAGPDVRKPNESAAKSTAAEAAPQEDDIVRDFRNTAYFALGCPPEINAIWSSTDSSGTINGEKAHLRIAPTTQLYPATADLPAVIRPAINDPSKSLSLGHVRFLKSLPEFPIVPAKLKFKELVQLSPHDLAERKRMEQTVLKQGAEYLIAIPQLLVIPDATVLEITKGSGNNPPIETLRVSPTEIVATVSIGQFDKRTVRANINKMGGNVDLYVTDMVNGQETVRDGIEALVDAKAAVESFFPGFFRIEEPQEEPLDPLVADLFRPHPPIIATRTIVYPKMKNFFGPANDDETSGL